MYNIPRIKVICSVKAHNQRYFAMQGEKPCFNVGCLKFHNDELHGALHRFSDLTIFKITGEFAGNRGSCIIGLFCMLFVSWLKITFFNAFSVLTTSQLSICLWEPVTQPRSPWGSCECICVRSPFPASSQYSHLSPWWSYNCCDPKTLSGLHQPLCEYTGCVLFWFTSGLLWYPAVIFILIPPLEPWCSSSHVTFSMYGCFPFSISVHLCKVPCHSGCFCTLT